MKLIVGLGNPGKKYARTRHNLGFLAVDILASRLQTTDYNQVRGGYSKNSQRFEWKVNKKLLSAVCRLPQVLLIKPQTFVNQSGIAIRKIVDFYRLKPKDVLVIRDDIDLLEGKIKGPYNKTGSGGHKGIESVKSTLASDEFYQLKIGVGRPPKGKEADDWVLEKIDDRKWQDFKDLLRKDEVIVEKIKNWLNGAV